MQQAVDVGAHRTAGTRTEEDVEAPVGVVVAQGVEAGLVLGGGVEGDGLAHVRLHLEEGAEGAAEEVGEEVVARHGGEGAKAAVDGDVVAAGEGAGEVGAVHGAGGGVVVGRGEEGVGGVAVGAEGEVGEAEGGVHDGHELGHLLLFHADGADAVSVREGAVEEHDGRAAGLLGGDRVQVGGVDEAERHAGDVGGRGAVVAHPAEGLVGGVVAGTAQRLRVARIRERAAGEEEVGGQIFLPHADALADQVVLVAAQFSLQPRQLPLVGLLLPAHPLLIRLGEVWEAESAGDVVDAAVESDVLALLRRRDGEGEALAGERGAVGGDVGEAEGEEGAWTSSMSASLVAGVRDGWDGSLPS